METFPAIQRKVAVLVKYYQTISPDYDFSFYATPLREANTPSARPTPPPPMKNH
jgi:hypothetical protein